jgi:hypothetical protein
MTINKTIKGEIVQYHVRFILNTMTAEVKAYFSDKPVIGKIDDDFNYIILPDDFLSPYLSGHGHVKVGKLKLNKQAKIDAIDYNEKKVNS